MSEQEEIRQWISEVSGKILQEAELNETLQNGVVLCEMINKVLSKDSSKGLKNPSMSKLSFFKMENIEYFIQKARLCGVPDSENFQTIDLYEGKNMKQFFNCIYSLSRNLFKNGRSDIRVIGPKLVEKKAILFTQEQLDEAKRTVSKQYGTIRTTKQ